MSLKNMSITKETEFNLIAEDQYCSIGAIIRKIHLLLLSQKTITEKLQSCIP